MKNLPTTAILIVITAVVIGVIYNSAEATGSVSLPTPQQSELMQPTATPTIGWQATAMVAQATSDEARRVNAEATVAHESFLAVGLEATMSSNDLELARVWQTATFALTAIPLTMTANSSIIEAANVRLETVKIQATMTADAPDLLYRYKQAEAYDAERMQNVEIALKYIIGIFIVALAFLVVVAGIMRLSSLIHLEPASAEEIETSIPNLDEEEPLVVPQYKAKALDSDFVIPCTPEQWGALAHGVIENNVPLGINQWESGDMPFSRETYYPIRNLFQRKQWMVVGSGMKYVPAAELEAAFRLWIAERRLPEGYSFKQEMPKGK